MNFITPPRKRDVLFTLLAIIVVAVIGNTLVNLAVEHWPYKTLPPCAEQGID